MKVYLLLLGTFFILIVWKGVYSLEYNYGSKTKYGSSKNDYGSENTKTNTYNYKSSSSETNKDLDSKDSQKYSEKGKDLGSYGSSTGYKSSKDVLSKKNVYKSKDTGNYGSKTNKVTSEKNYNSKEKYSKETKGGYGSKTGYKSDNVKDKSEEKDYYGSNIGYKSGKNSYNKDQYKSGDTEEYHSTKAGYTTGKDSYSTDKYKSEDKKYYGSKTGYKSGKNSYDKHQYKSGDTEGYHGTKAGYTTGKDSYNKDKYKSEDKEYYGSKTGYKSDENTYDKKDKSSNEESYSSKTGYKTGDNEHNNIDKYKSGEKEGYYGSKTAYKSGENEYNNKEKYKYENKDDYGSQTDYKTGENDYKNLDKYKSGTKGDYSSKTGYKTGTNEYYKEKYKSDNKGDYVTKTGYKTVTNDYNNKDEYKSGNKEDYSSNTGYKTGKIEYNNKDKYKSGNKRDDSSKTGYKTGTNVYNNKDKYKSGNTKVYGSKTGYKTVKNEYNNQDQYKSGNTGVYSSKTGYNTGEKSYNKKDKHESGDTKEYGSKTGYKNEKDEYNNKDKYKSGNKDYGFKTSYKSGTSMYSKKGKKSDYGSKDGYDHTKNYGSTSGSSSSSEEGYKTDKGYKAGSKSKLSSERDIYIRNKILQLIKKKIDSEKPKTQDEALTNRLVKDLYFYTSPRHCKPICSCFMNGIYYEHGDRWQMKNNPCTTFECKDGYYEAVVQGVQFKGECKNVHTTWTEGCFTYEAVLAMHLPVYRLKEGGCRDADGNCYKVGEQFRRNCNLYECQIVGTCYTLTLLQKGCTFEGQCKEINNYWHDGCSVFQCVDYGETVDYERLHKEIMYWPEGDYAMLKPETGCPVDVENEWSEGSRLHYGKGQNYKSTPFNAFGNYTELFFNHSFCVRQQVDDQNIFPRYQTYWEPGQYCILRKNGACPKNFREGIFTLDDIDGLEFQNHVNGTLPDGEFNLDTAIECCCRNDGKLDYAIVLPKERPFILFVEASASDCQTVRGMTHTLEFFAFHGMKSETKSLMNGSLPMIKDGTNHTEVYFCHYKPIDCGCDDGQGNTVRIGERIKKGCAWYVCKDTMGVKFLDPVVGGCMDENGKCRNESEVWSISSGESCVQMRCVKDVTSLKNQFKVKIDYKGCRDGAECRPANYIITRQCFISVCTARKDRPQYYFKMKRAGCSDGKGGCVALGKEFKKGCMTYKCASATSKCGLKFVRGGCQYDDGCHEVGAVWQHASCNWLKCSMERKSKSITFTVNTTQHECSYQGKCFKAGFRLKGTCRTLECRVDTITNNFNMDIVDGGCQWKGKCMSVNTTWIDGCIQYVCRWYKQEYIHTFRPEIAVKKCRFKDECIGDGEVRASGCMEYICSTPSDNKAQHAVLKPYKMACQDKKGNCLAVNEEIEENCFKYKCVGNATMTSLIVVGGGCNVGGICKPEGSEWTEDHGCVDYKCVREDKNGLMRMMVRPVSVGCPDGKTCHKNGTFWPTPNMKCFKTECSVSKGHDNKFTRKKITSPAGCNVNNECIPINAESKVGCMTYKCQKNPQQRSVFYGVIKAGCREFYSEKCHDVGTNWIEKSGMLCMKLTCVRNNNSIGYQKQYMCKDSSGNCIKPGGYFMHQIGNGKRIRCKCELKGGHPSVKCSSSYR